MPSRIICPHLCGFLTYEFLFAKMPTNLIQRLFMRQLTFVLRRHSQFYSDGPHTYLFAVHRYVFRITVFSYFVAIFSESDQFLISSVDNHAGLGKKS